MSTPTQSITITFVTALLFTGCASKQRFGYSVALAPSRSAAARTVEVLPIADTRTNRLIDRHFMTNLLADVREVVGKELESTGLFRPQITLALTPALSPREREKKAAPSPILSRPTGEGQSDGRGEPKSGALQEARPTSELQLKTELRRLEWEVPHYNAILGKTFLFSFLGGIIGGGIYISTPTPVNGWVVVHLELTEAQGGRVLLAKEYPGFYTEKRAKASCDTGTTKRRVSNEAFKDAMSKFKVDLKESPAAPPASAGREAPRRRPTLAAQ